MQLKNEEAPAAVGRSGEGGYEACTHDTTSRRPKRNHESEAAKLPRDKFVWRGLSLHLGQKAGSNRHPRRHASAPVPNQTSGWMDELSGEYHQGVRCRVWACSLFAGGGTPAEASYSPEHEVEAGREAV
jgi:hypothetical protein